MLLFRATGLVDDLHIAEAQSTCGHDQLVISVPHSLHGRFPSNRSTHTTSKPSIQRLLLDLMGQMWSVNVMCL